MLIIRLTIAFSIVLAIIIPALVFLSHDRKVRRDRYTRYWDNWKSKGGTNQAFGLIVQTAYDQEWSEEKIRNFRMPHETEEGDKQGWNLR